MYCYTSTTFMYKNNGDLYNRSRFDNYPCKFIQEYFLKHCRCKLNMLFVNKSFLYRGKHLIDFFTYIHYKIKLFLFVYSTFI